MPEREVIFIKDIFNIEFQKKRNKNVIEVGSFCVKMVMNKLIIYEFLMCEIFKAQL